MIHLEKLEQAKQLVAASDLDVWLTFVRETTALCDPVLPLICEFGMTWQSAFIVAKSGMTFAVVGNYDADAIRQLGGWNQVVPYVHSIRDRLLAVLELTIPASVTEPRIGINTSESDDKADGITLGMFHLLTSILEGTRFEGCLVSAADVVIPLRSQKTESELEAIEDAIQVTEGIFEWMTSTFVQIGMTELQIYRGVQTLIDQRGYSYGWERAGNPIVNCGPDSQAGHGLPSSQIALAHGHILHIDLGIATRNYSSDIQRCWYVGSDVPADVKHVMAAVVGAIDAAAAVLRPGVQGWMVDAAAREAITSAGYPEYMHAVGHQVGRFAHDGGTLLGPRWERYGDAPDGIVQPREVYTLELGVELSGAGVVSIEEMVVVTTNGCEFLTERQTEMWLLRR
ncbi:MAG: M24 family metallopeptidase [Armatimonadota bacterium]